ncbi:hypothetical protein [Zhongshania arctica]|uniref:Uncharacterized protein n=1 Tax=Zhongshania arctica TaxID=3238302 RepID=A0ABV3TUZ2_9GAMM
MAARNTTSQPICDASLLWICGQQLLGKYSPMELTALQAYNIEKAIVSGRSIAPIKR